ncbi:MAG: hypothetical protein A2W23_03575 [Planctomycetes bacterium RBG_16_43_13]|nr:MAG: hypothetical protein A2W23_03575 [Planctomycetes bacterium RBG_16_43_13]
MVFDFFLQSFLGLAFFGGLVGIGLLFLRVFKVRKSNISLLLALSFFISLCSYVGGAVICLSLVQWNSIIALKVFSLLYIILSYSIVGYYLFKRSSANKIEITALVKENGVIFLGLLVVVIVLFLGAYKTPLLDEWLHRPVVKFFVTNGEFPLKNPLQPNQDFSKNYHYGLDIAGSAIQLLTKIGVSESLDVMKIGFIVASFLLFYGLLFEWSKRKYYSVAGTIILLFSGASFFFLDGFSSGHWHMLGIGMRAMNYPLLYLLLGITWVNLPLTLAFVILAKKLFYDEVSYSFGNIISLIFLLVGYFLISELFAVFIILCLCVLTVRNILKRNISLPRIAVLSIIFVAAMAVGIYISGGAIVGALKNMSVSSFMSLKSFSSWGYPSTTDIVNPAIYWFSYLRNFLLEVVIGVFLVYVLFRKKITLAQQPLMFFGLLVTFIVPFIFSTPMGDINLYKLTHFGIILLHLLFFYYFSYHRSTLFFSLVIVLFVFGSLPVVFTNYNIQLGNDRLAWAFRCSESELCYDKSSVEVLNQLQEKNRGIKYVMTSSRDAQKVVDIANAYAVNYNGVFDYDYLKQEKVQYIFVSPRLRLELNDQQLEYLGSLEKIAEKGKYEIFANRVNPYINN